MTEPLTIAMLSLHSSPLGRLGKADTGGMSIYLLELAKALAGRGHRIDIFTRVLAHGEDTLIEYATNVRVIGLRVPGTEHLVKDQLYGHLPDYLREIGKFSRLQQENYHLVHSSYWLSAVVGDQLQKLWGCPHLITFHTLARAKMDAREDHQEDRLRIDEEERLMKCCDGVMVGTGAERNRLMDLLAPAGAPLYLVPLGVDLEHFKPLPAARTAAEVKSRRSPRILFVGRFDPMKGVDTAISAMALLDEQTEPELLLVGGDGPDGEARNRLAGLARELQLQHRVRFAGAIDYLRLPEIYREADILVAPSFYESFGLVVLEALASGIPVAATPTGVAAEVIVPGLNGHFAAAGDGVSLAKAIADTLSLARTRDPQAVRNSVQLDDWSRVADLVLSVYNGALSKRSDILK